MTAADAGPEYAAPAVDKALDILELLADATGGMTQLDIATAVGRSPGQIFRVLQRLDRRGFVHRDAQGGYHLSMRLFDLAHRHEPVRMLVTAAVPAMRELATEIGQSCNLGVREGDGVRIVAQVESPADFGFRVRVGAVFPAAETATGAVLRAFGPGERDASGQDAELGARNAAVRGRGASGSAPNAPGQDAGLDAIRRDGRLVRPDAVQPGITDIVVPILRAGSTDAVAALTVPYVATSFSATTAEDVAAAAARTAVHITEALGV